MQEAESILIESGLEAVYETTEEEIDKENTYIEEQTPKAGIVVSKGSKVYLK